jgi:acetolactate synthase I/II/III large subunit
MTGSCFLAEQFHLCGLSHVFFMPTIATKALAAMESLGITRVSTHGEKAAAYMADGYARARRGPGICMAQNVGSANLAAGLRDAYMACSPVIAITGGADTDSRYRHTYQEVEDFSMFEPVTKANMELDDVRRLPDLLRQAFRVATSGAPGPVHLRMAGRHANAIEEEADLELIVEDTFLHFPAFRPEPEAARVRHLASVLAEAERPVIVAGGGVTASQAVVEIVELAEKLGMPVATSLNGKGTILDSHPLAVGVIGTYSRACAQKVVSEADLVFFVGSHTGGQVTTTWKIPKPGTTVVQLDVDPEELGRNYPAKAMILGDAKVSLRQLIEVVEPAKRDEWTARARQLVADWRSEVASHRDSDEAPMRPERVCKELSQHLPSNAVVVADTGHSGIWTGTMWDLNSPDQRYIRCAGSLGWAFSASLGVKCALPDRPVLCFSGDGGFYYHMAELETAARYGINAVVLVNNNHSLNQEQRLFNAAYGGQPTDGQRQMWVYQDINLARVADDMGCLGIRVERPSEIAGALDRAFSANRPVLIDCVTDIAALHDRAWGSGQAN